eukprot:5479717-Pyramimonas_sp.AAC.1
MSVSSPSEANRQARVRFLFTPRTAALVPRSARGAPRGPREARTDAARGVGRGGAVVVHAQHALAEAHHLARPVRPESLSVTRVAFGH